MISQILILFSFPLAYAAQPYERPGSGYPYSASNNLQLTRPQPYNFIVDVTDEHGTTLKHQEAADDLNNKRGSYGYTDAYGITRQVDYVADEKGFRAVVKTNEPGTSNQNPADVEIISNTYDSASVPTYFQTVPNYESTSVYERPRAVPRVLSTGGQPLRHVYSAPYGFASQSPVTSLERAQPY